MLRAETDATASAIVSHKLNNGLISAGHHASFLFCVESHQEMVGWMESLRSMIQRNACYEAIYARSPDAVKGRVKSMARRSAVLANNSSSMSTQ